MQLRPTARVYDAGARLKGVVTYMAEGNLRVTVQNARISTARGSGITLRGSVDGYDEVAVYKALSLRSWVS